MCQIIYSICRNSEYFYFTLELQLFGNIYANKLKKITIYGNLICYYKVPFVKVEFLQPLQFTNGFAQPQPQLV